MSSSRPITLLHLSDLHFGRKHRFGGFAPPDGSLETLLSLWGDDLQRLRDNHDLRPDLLVLTGDLTEHGLSSEFDDALRLIEGLLELVRLTRDRVVIVPGDHDVNRAASAAYFLECQSEEDEPVPPYWPKWKSYARMFRSFYSDPSSGGRFIEYEPWSLFVLPDLEVVVAGLNSTMANSHRAEDDYGFLGQLQLRWFADLLDEYVRQGWLRIGALHHHVARDSASDDKSLRDADDLVRVLEKSLHLLLHGHLHDGKPHWLAPELPMLATDHTVSFESRPEGNYSQCQMIKIHRNSFERWPRTYDPDRGYWTGDTEASDTGKLASEDQGAYVHNDSAITVLPAKNTKFPAPEAGTAHASALLLRIYAQGLRKGMELSFVIDAADPELELENYHAGSVKVQSDPKDLVLSLFADIETLGTSRDQLITQKRIAAKGAYLFRNLVPTLLQEVLWRLRDGEYSLQIQSHEPWIPWELAKLERPGIGHQASGPFLCEAFSVTRWLPGVPEITQLSLDDIALIAPKARELPNQAEEENFITSLSDSGREVSMIPAEYLAVTEALATGRYNVIHYAGSGVTWDDDPNLWSIDLDEGEVLTVEDISGDVRNLGNAKPIVFWNSGYSVRAGLSATGIGGWPKQFLDAGAGAFVGPYFNTSDELAAAFAVAFYGQLSRGVPIGEAARRARIETRQQARGDPMWLAYTVYAHPLASCPPSTQARPSTEALRELPDGPFETTGIRLAHRFREAEQISGDFYNVIPRNDGAIGIYLVDVVGHGLAAASQAFAVKQALSDAGEDWGIGEAKEQLTRADRVIAENLSDRNVAITMSFVEIDSGSMKARFANAGMPFPLLFRAGQVQPQTLRAAGVFVGSGYTQYPVEPRQVEVDLQDGDVMVHYSDGVLEASDSKGRNFGQGGIIAAIATAGNGDPESMADEVMRAVTRHVGKDRPQDDQTLVVVRIGEAAVDQRKPRIRALEEITHSSERLEFSLRNAEDSPHALHHSLRPRLRTWLSEQRLGEETFLKIWAAVWEALKNGIQHGSRRGEILRFHFARTDDGIRIRAVQPQTWQDWDAHLGQTAKENAQDKSKVLLGGTVAMLRLASSIHVSHQGRQLSMDFDLAESDKSPEKRDHHGR